MKSTGPQYEFWRLGGGFVEIHEVSLLSDDTKTGFMGALFGQYACAAG